MPLDVAGLLAPIDGDDPAGPDLAYDPGRQELEQAFEVSVSIDATGGESGAADVDWRKIISLTEKQLGKTKDVWLPVYLCRAGARAGDLDAVAAGAEILGALIEEQWETVHPKLDELGVPGRKTPCDSLASQAEFVGPLMRAPLLVHSRLGAFSGADLQRFEKDGVDAEGYGLFRGALEDTDQETFADILGRLERIEGGFKRADAAFTGHAPNGESPNFGATYEALSTLKRSIQAFAPAGESAPPQAEAAAPAEGGPAPAASPGGRLTGRVESREDVVKALDAVCDYYRRHEPTSPVPLVLQRAREWVALDFLSVLQDIAPAGLGEARGLLAGRKKPQIEDDDDD
jgi:type VI secretion system ImpA family protein